MTQSNDNLVTAAGLHKSFGKGDGSVHVLRGLDLAVRHGEFLAIMGPSGCGKSTLLHIMGLMTPCDDGILTLGDEAVGNNAAQRTLLRRTKIGFVFQRFNLISVLSARQNVGISLRVRGLKTDDRVDTLFERLGIADIAHRKPGQMSIGQQQRVAVVRAVAHRPALLLADEPTGNLDSASSEDLLSVFREMNRDERQTIVMITHSADAAAHADRILHMKDGRILD